ncbi:MAG: hypothetical protein ACKO2L_07775 [Planctomycetaceae bacterium]
MSDVTGVPEETPLMGPLSEAVELAEKLLSIEVDPSREGEMTLNERLKMSNTSKEVYYRIRKEFEAVSRLDLTDLIQAEYRRRVKGIDHNYAWFFDWGQSLHRLAREIESRGSEAVVRIRVGVSEHLAMGVVYPVKKAFLSWLQQKLGCDRSQLLDLIDVDIQIGFSGDLHKMLVQEKSIDIYVSRLCEFATDSDVEIYRNAEHVDVVEMKPALVCHHEHPAAVAFRNVKSTENIGVQEAFARNTVLLHLGNHPRRIHRNDQVELGEIRRLVRSLTIQSESTLTRLHDRLYYGSHRVAAITVPEFVEVVRWRDLSVIPLNRIEVTKGKTLDNDDYLKPLKMCVAFRAANTDSLQGTDSNAPDKRLPSRPQLIRQLASMFFRKMTEWRLPDRQESIFGRDVSFCFERTNPSHNRGHATTGWTHSLLRLRLLSNGAVIGEHFTEENRTPDGSLTSSGSTELAYHAADPARIFHVLGWILEGEKKDLQLLWVGYNQTGESYAVSFVIPQETRQRWSQTQSGESSDWDVNKNIVGLWTGRRNSAAGSRFEPASGQVVIFVQNHDTLLGCSPTPEKQKQMLQAIIASVKKWEEKYPGYASTGISGAWEWSPKDEELPRAGLATTPLAGINPSPSAQALVTEFSELLKNLKSRLGVDSDETEYPSDKDL